MHGITGVDHPVIAVRSLDAARQNFERLGFTLSGRGAHQEWGTGNSCIMFPHDYLELTGILDPRRYTHNLGEFLKMREGLVGVAFGTKDAEMTFQSLVAAGIAVKPVGEVTRNLETSAGIRQPRFKVCFLDRAETPGLPSTAICEHLTPELLRNPEELRHRNSAFRIVSITVPVPDFDAAIHSYRKLFGGDLVRCAGTCVEARTGRGAVIRLVSEPGLEHLELAVTDIGAVRESLENSPVHFTAPSRGALRLGPESTCGLIVDFVEKRESTWIAV
jgi:catechol 2,3-dioxygenase-like lactoylglutathione lyase family enzyme